MDSKTAIQRFDMALKEIRAIYDGPESDIGNWIYSHKGTNDPVRLAEVAEECLYRIRRGVAIK
jgi:hypothetical protein